MIERIAWAVGTAFCLLSVSCDREARPKTVTANQLVIAVPADPVTLDPVAMQEVNSAAIGNAIHAPLIRLDQGGRVVPVLADAVEVDSDGLRAVIKLHPGAKFWDGSEVRPEDVQASFERLKASTSPLKWVTDRIQNFNKTADHELVVRFSQPEPDFVKLIANLQAAIVKSGTEKLPKQPFDSQVVGAGAFMPVGGKLEPGVAFSLKANPGFPRRGKIDGLVFSIVPETQNQLEAFRAGRVDIVRLRGPAISEACTMSGGVLKPRPTFGKATVASAPASELGFAVINWENPKLSSVSVADRAKALSALSSKVSRQAIAQSLYLGTADGTAEIAPPSTVPALHLSAPDPGSFEFSPRLQTPLLSANDAMARQFATFLAPACKEIGWDVEPQFVEVPKLVEGLLKKDFAISTLYFEMPVAGIGPWTMFFEQGNPFAAFGEGLPGVKEKVQSARGILDESARNAAYAEIVIYITARQTAWLPVVSRRTVLLFNDRVDGLFIDACGTPVWSFLGYHE